MLHLNDILCSARVATLKLLRLAAFFVAVWFVGAAFVLRAVSADVNEAMLGLGAELMAYPHAPGREVRQLDLNGVRVHFQTQSIDAEPLVVLDHYEVLCQRRDARLTERLSRLLNQHPRAPKDTAQLRAVSTHTMKRGDRGYVACLDMGADGHSLATLAQRFQRFIRTGNLSEVGHLRYAFAQPIEGSSGERTFLLTIWTDSVVDLYKMLPFRGRDASGTDVDDVPRPPHSRRILSSREIGHPNGVAIYTTSLAPVSELERFYRDSLLKHGWTPIERHEGESIQVNGTHLLAAQQQDRTVAVLMQDKASHSVVTILTSGAP